MGLAEGPARVMLRLGPRHLLIRAEPVAASLDRDRSAGIAAISVVQESPARSGHKLVDRPGLRAAAHAAREAGVGEALVFDGELRLLEGATSNVFCHLDDGLVTPPLTAGILPGVTRSKVLDVARATDTGLIERAVSLDEVRSAREIFLTSAVRRLVGVVRLDGRPVGPGRTGPVTRRLAAGLDSLIHAALDELRG
jgi:D-alanine transaminase